MLAPREWSPIARWLALLVVATAATMFVFIRSADTREPEAAIALLAGPCVERAAPTVEFEGEREARLAAVAARVRPSANVVTTALPAPAAGVLRGVLVRPDRGPTGDGHTIVLIETERDGAPRNEGGRVVVTPELDGRFELRLPEWAFVAPVLLVGRAPHHMPATFVLRPPRDVPFDDVELLLGEGAVLRGRVVHGGDPVAGWPVELDLRFGVPGVFDAGTEGFWLDGRFVEKHARTTTGVLGDFELMGLARDRYDLRRARLSPSIPSVHTEVVQVDGSELVIDLAGAELAVVVTGPGGVIEGAEVRVTCERGEVHFRSARAPLVVDLPAHSEVTLLAEHESHESHAMTLTTGARDERIAAVLALEPAVRPALRVWLPGAHEARLNLLSLDLLPLDGSARERRIELRRGAARDEFWLAILPASPGPHALRFGSVGAYCSEVVGLEVPDRGVVEVAFEGHRGGRFAVDLESELERWSAAWRIRDADGREVVPQRNWSVAGGAEFEFSMMETFGEGRRTLVPDVDVLPPGRYVLEVESEQHDARSVEFDIVIGETARLDVRLRPR